MTFTSYMSFKDGGVFFLRVKVKIICQECGEFFILSGKKEQGKIETGFKQCLCDNQQHFEIEEHFF
jgi:hypothetical protein